LIEINAPRVGAVKLALAARGPMTSRSRATCLAGRIAGWLGTILLATWAQQVAAQEIGDIAAGQKLAETWCSSCHVVAPTPDRGTSNGAPTSRAARCPSAGRRSVTR